MKILLVNKFFFRKGGADVYNLDLGKLLESKGHEVAYFSMQHLENKKSKWDKYFVSAVDLRKRQGIVVDAKTAGRFIYNLEAKKKLTQLLKDFNPDVIHFNNIYHQLSTSVLDAAAKHPAAKVMTLHDYKLICPNYKLFTEGRVCERCYRHKYYQAIVHRCLQDSCPASALAAMEMYFAKARQIYENVVDCFVSPSQFLAQKTRDWNVKFKRMETLANFVDLAEFKPNYEPGEYYLYFGRLSEEKGLSDLLRVFGEQGGRRLKIAGTGPLEQSLKETIGAQGLANIQLLGYQEPNELRSIIAKSRAVIVPTLMHDNYPYSVIEAQAMGKAVIASRMGGIPEMVKPGMNGYLYEPRNPNDLAARVEDAEKNINELSELGKAGRARGEKENIASGHYEKLMNIYQSIKKK